MVQQRLLSQIWLETNDTDISLTPPLSILRFLKSPIFLSILDDSRTCFEIGQYLLSVGHALRLQNVSLVKLHLGIIVHPFTNFASLDICVTRHLSARILTRCNMCYI